MNQTFECLKCGHCCERIIVEGLGGIKFGLCLFPGEQKLFEAFPDALVPYIGLRGRSGKRRVEIICYQMIQACPLYNPVNKTCARYDERPSVCRSYPFSGMGDGYSLEQHCSWVKELGEVTFGETVLRAGSVPDAAIADDRSFFMSLDQRMKRTGERMVFYDASNDVWLEPVRG